MLTNEVPEQSAARVPEPRRQGHRLIAVVLAVGLAAFCAATARLFMFPAWGMPARVDAIVMLAGQGDRYHEALELARQHRAPYLAISLGASSSSGQGTQCAAAIPQVKVICFAPDLATTQGEAEYAGRLAAKYHWHSVALVTITPQAWRARLGAGRCFGGRIYVMAGSLHAYGWPYEIAYEWAATFKALALQRSC
jgi:uncharacterized SAM-binding protein YcdF (DUF218 family)